jgi:hypothetical protein
MHCTITEHAHEDNHVQCNRAVLLGLLLRLLLPLLHTPAVLQGTAVLACNASQVQLVPQEHCHTSSPVEHLLPWPAHHAVPDMGLPLLLLTLLLLQLL